MHTDKHTWTCRHIFLHTCIITIFFTNLTATFSSLFKTYCTLSRSVTFFLFFFWGEAQLFFQSEWNDCMSCGVQESISTCRFAQRVAMIKNDVMLNEELDPKLMIAKLQRTVQELRQELAMLTSEQRTDELTEEDMLWWGGSWSCDLQPRIYFCNTVEPEYLFFCSKPFPWYFRVGWVTSDKGPLLKTAYCWGPFFFKQLFYLDISM